MVRLRAFRILQRLIQGIQLIAPALMFRFLPPTPGLAEVALPGEEPTPEPNPLLDTPG